MSYASASHLIHQPILLPRATAALTDDYDVATQVTAPLVAPAKLFELRAAAEMENTAPDADTFSGAVYAWLVATTVLFMLAIVIGFFGYLYDGVVVKLTAAFCLMASAVCGVSWMERAESDLDAETDV